MTYCKIKLFSGTILDGASNEPEAYLEPSQISARKHFGKNGKQLVAVDSFFYGKLWWLLFKVLILS